MRSRPNKESQKHSQNPTFFEPHPRQSTQHGSPLLDVPGEILSAISANLDPPALLALGQSHAEFARHVEEDSTWRNAFEAHYGTDLLRRSQPTWRKEFSERHKLLLRFGLSRVPSTTHSPLPAPAISHIHLLTANAGLLSLSLTYGIVARSIPFSGRVLPGFIDASGSTTGRGVLNADFIPNVSSCALASAGGTVRILWGYRTGQVAFMLTNRTMENPRRPAADFRMSQLEEGHAGSVNDLVWIDEGDSRWLAVSGGADGLVKVWDFSSPSTPDLLWTSHGISPVDRDPCLKVAADRALGELVTVRKSGTIDVWFGLSFTAGNLHSGKAVIPAPDLFGRTNLENSKVLALHLDRHTGSILVAFHGDVCFYRIDVTPNTTIVTAYGEPEGGIILSSLQPYFVPQFPSGEKSFVLTGDKFGYVHVYEWDSSPTNNGITVIRPIRSFQAIPSVVPNAPIASGSHSKQAFVPTKQESVTALTWTPTVLVTGTSSGVVAVWDSLTFERIRVILRPAGLRRVRRRHPHQVGGQGQDAEDDDERPNSSIKEILVDEDGDAMVINVGGEIVAWRAGDVASSPSGKNALPVGKGSRSKLTTRGGATGTSRGALAIGRWSEQSEVKHEISESHALYKRGMNELDAEEERDKRLIATSERAQRNQLKKLGLSEGEALEYVLMLSREGRDVNPNAGASTSAILDDDAVLQSNVGIAGGLGLGEALTDEQVQAALEEGVFTLDEALAPSIEPSQKQQEVALDSEINFPAIVTTPNGGTSLSPSTTGSPLSYTDTAPMHPASLVPLQRKLSIASSVSSSSTRSSNKSVGSVASKGSGTSGKVAWSVPLAMTASASDGATTSGSRKARRKRASGGGGGGLADLDDDLKFALELSLAEARSRGEEV